LNLPYRSARVDFDTANALAQTGDGGYALAGYTLSFGAGNEDFWLVKTDDNGKIDMKDIGTVARHFGEHYP
jgi:hypothetical protein